MLRQALDMEEMIWFGPWLLRQASRLAPGVKLFKFTYLEMVVMFREAMEVWNLADAVLYRMCHGGASHDIVSNQRSVLEVKKRGRWANDQSLKLYAKGVRLQKVEMEAGQEALARARKYFPRLSHLFASRAFG